MNLVTLTGTIASKLTYSHTVLGEEFYFISLNISRLSNVVDTINIIVSETLINLRFMSIGSRISVTGEFRSHNESEHLLLNVFATDIVPASNDAHDTNEIIISGFICKNPTYRKTPLGREITDALLAVGRKYSKSDYIPCVFWGRQARYISNLSVGDELEVCGRIQSRQYIKNGETKTAYEVSVVSVKEM